MQIVVSVIICTCNNASSLKETLRAFQNVRRPDDWEVELIVVDNASTDETADEVRQSDGKLDVRYLYEPKRGLSNARNAGLNMARGEAILFTDDDVMPCDDWIEKMAGPLLRRECDAITGRIELSKDLIRPWMTPMHDVWLAAARVINTELVGACMGIHRSVLEEVPAFDPELGAGALGFAEESLFSDQLCLAGFRLKVIDDNCVVHYPRASRLVRREWLSSAGKRGRSWAYVIHHWEHADPRISFLRFYYFQMKLGLRRLLQPPPKMDAEGCPAWELSYIVEIEKYRWLMKEFNRPRNYKRHGLRKLN